MAEQTLLSQYAVSSLGLMEYFPAGHGAVFVVRLGREKRMERVRYRPGRFLLHRQCVQRSKPAESSAENAVGTPRSSLPVPAWRVLERHSQAAHSSTSWEDKIKWAEVETREALAVYNTKFLHH